MGGLVLHRCDTVGMMSGLSNDVRLVSVVTDLAPVLGDEHRTQSRLVCMENNLIK